MAADIKIIRAIPGSTSIAPILRDFCRAEGVVTALSDSLLHSIRLRVPEDVPVQVETFGKVVRDFLALCGEEALYIAPRSHRRAAIALACERLESDSPFYRSRHFAGTHEVLATALDNLDDHEIDTATLADLTARASPHLAAKLKSLAGIAEMSDIVMRDLGQQTSSHQIRECLETLPERDGAFERMLVFAGGEIPPLHRRWLRWASEHGSQITVVLDRHAEGAPLFIEADEAAAAFGTPESVSDEGNQLLRSLFMPEPQPGAKLNVTIRPAADSLSECEWAVRGCLDHPQPDRCAIYVRHLGTYGPLLESAALRLGLPVRILRRSPLLTNGFARLTLSLIELCAGRDVRQLEPVLRSSYLDLDTERRVALTAAIRSCHRARGNAWPQLEQFAAAHRDAIPWLADLLEWRRKAISEPHDPRTWLGLIHELTRAGEVMPWSTASLQSSAQMRERDIRARNRMEQLIGDELSVLNVAEPRPKGLREIAKLCRRVWSDADVSIPSAEEGVTLTDSSQSIGSTDILFVLGMLEGVFPRRRSEDPVLTDAELGELEQLTGTRIPNSHSRALQERDEFYRVCAAAGNRLCMSYPETDDQRDNIPAFYLTEVERVCAPNHFRKLPLESRLVPAEADCVSPSDLAIARALSGPLQEAPRNQLESSEARALVPVGDLELSPAALREALQCPFEFFVRRVLGIDPGRPESRWLNLLRLPRSGGLYLAPSPQEAIAAMEEALDAQVDALYAEIPDWEIQALRSGGRRLIADWVAKEFRAREIWPRDPDSVRENATFGEELRGDVRPGVSLKGSVPAISRLGRHRVGHLVQRSAEISTKEGHDRLFLGLHLMALMEAGSYPALDVQGMNGSRALVVVGRDSSLDLSADGQTHRIVDLSEEIIAKDGREKFYRQVRASLDEALASIRSGDVEDRPGLHCASCDFGELCRRSSQFGESRVLDFSLEFAEATDEEEEI